MMLFQLMVLFGSLLYVNSQKPIHVILWMGQSNQAARRPYPDLKETICYFNPNCKSRENKLVNLIQKLRYTRESSKRKAMATAKALEKYKEYYYPGIFESKKNMVNLRVRYESTETGTERIAAHQAEMLKFGYENEINTVGIDVSAANVLDSNKDYLFITCAYSGGKLKERFIPGKTCYNKMMELVNNINSISDEIRFDPTLKQQTGPTSNDLKEARRFLQDREFIFDAFVYFQGHADRSTKSREYENNLKLLISEFKKIVHKTAIIGIGSSRRINKIQKKVAKRLDAIFVDASKYSKQIHYTSPAYLVIGTELGLRL